MEKEILKFNKSLSLIDDKEVEVGESISIDQYSDVIKEFDFEIPFVFYSTNNQTPYIEDIDFSVVAREKVDLTAYGPSEDKVKRSEKVEKFKPVDLPPGFVELKKADI